MKQIIIHNRNYSLAYINYFRRLNMPLYDFGYLVKIYKNRKARYIS